MNLVSVLLTVLLALASFFSLIVIVYVYQRASDDSP